MNLNDLYEMRDPRDAYQRDVANSHADMNQQSRADVTGEEEPSGVFTVVINGRPWKTGSSNEMIALAGRVANKHTDKKVAVKWPTGELNAVKPQSQLDEFDVDSLNQMASHAVNTLGHGGAGLAAAATGTAIGGAIAGAGKKAIDWYQKKKEQKAQARQQGVAEGSQRVDSLVTDALKIMRGPELSDAITALKTILGDREYNDRRGHYSFYVKQILDMYGQQGVTESDEYGAVTSAITRRIITQHPEVLAKYGPAVVGQAIDEIAEFVGDVEEIGSSDVSGWVSQVIRSLGRFAPVRDEGVDEGEITKTSTGVIHKATDKYGAGEEPFTPHNPGKYARDLGSVNKQQVKDLDASMGINWKSRGTKGVEVDESEVDSDGYSVDHADSGEYDYEGDQARDQLNTIVRAARRLDGLLDDNENMPEWVQMKVTLAADYIDTAADYIESNQEPELDEGEKVGNMDADKFDSAMARLKQLAGAGPMKTVYDPAKRVYRNVPTAVQPKK
jgi:hypothetical protein